jgi:endoglucanase
MRGLYHQRCGTPLLKPFGAYERPACHHPSIRKIFQSRIRRLDRQCDACKDVESTDEARDVAGGWHDAGDWDREDWHFGVPMVLSFIYEMAPDNFKDGELLIPEAGNGLPDILDEAQWGLSYWRRLQRPDGGVSPGLFMDSFPDPGEAAENCGANWYIYAEDPQASYRYAAAACHFSFALEKAGKAGEIPGWVESAAKAYEWAEKNQRPGDAPKVKDDRLHAAACLFRATGQAGYHAAFKEGLAIQSEATPLTVWGKWDQAWAVFSYLSTPKGTDPALLQRLKQATKNFARSEYLEPASKRGMRGAVNWYRPMSWGGITQPDDLALFASHALCGDGEALAGAEASLDLFLGGGPLNLSFMMGVGSQNPDGIFHPDSWMHLGPDHVAPGLLAFGPSAYQGEGDPKAGPWDIKFTHLSFYPPAKDWPPLELYSDARICYPMNEFTVMQIANVAAQFGYLVGN